MPSVSSVAYSVVNGRRVPRCTDTLTGINLAHFQFRFSLDKAPLTEWVDAVDSIEFMSQHAVPDHVAVSFLSVMMEQTGSRGVLPDRTTVEIRPSYDGVDVVLAHDGEVSVVVDDVSVPAR